MKKRIKITAIITVAAFLFAIPQFANADDRYRSHRGKSTTEKIITGLAVGALAGLAIYALTRDDDRHGRRHSGRYYSQRRHSGVEVNFGFQSYSTGSPYSRGHRYQQRGYWHNHQGHRFYRTPYRYNHRYDRAFNEGFERGYWAGYTLGLRDSRNRYGYSGRFNGPRRQLWGYSSGYGHYSNYERGFHQAFGIGYRHGYNGMSYGHQGFGFGVRVKLHR